MIGKRGLRVLGILYLVIGILFILNGSSMTGFAISEGIGVAKGFLFYLGVVFMGIGAMVLIGVKDLERILDQQIREGKRSSGLVELEKDRDDYLKKNNHGNRREHVRASTEPLVEYTEHDAIEYIERYKSSPSRNKVSIPGDEAVQIKAKINWKVDYDPLFEKVTEKSSYNDRIWKEANKRLFNLSVNSALGTINEAFKYIPHSSRYLYLRSLGGARVFLEKVSAAEYNLLAIASGEQRKVDEEKIIKKLESYGNRPTL
jgi:hypothetical protein